MKRIIKPSLTIALVIAALETGQPAAASQQLIVEAGNWRAVTADQGGRHYCFVISSPTQRMPLELKRDPGSFFVSLKPESRGGGTEISIEFGYRLASAGNLVAVDDKSFELISRDQMGWLGKEADEGSLVRAMRAGLDLRVSARSARGNQTTDVYDLRGFSAALAELQKRCRP